MMTINNKPFKIVQRAKTLFDQYETESHDPIFDVTLSILALGGVLSYLKTKECFPQTLQMDIHSVAKKHEEKGNDFSLGKTCIHLRNAIAHSHIEVKGPTQGEIESISFSDYANDEAFSMGDSNFTMEITVDDLKLLFTELSIYVVDNGI